jgi:hypothetical protein
MSRHLLAILALGSLAAFAFADPIKKATKVDNDKIAKECVESFIKAVMEGKGDDAIKFLATPFRDHGGQKKENLDEFKRDFDRPPPAGAEIKASGEPFELSKFNEVLKKKEFKELDADTIKSYEEFIGKEGRIILIELTQNGKPAPVRDSPPHMLIRVKDGKAHIVGVGGR